jgi:hypothetical protein
VEAIAAELGLRPPAPQQSIVVEVPKRQPPGAALAREGQPAREARAEKSREVRP